MVKRCIGVVHCPATGAARGHYSCLTDAISSLLFFITKYHRKRAAIEVAILLAYHRQGDDRTTVKNYNSE